MAINRLETNLLEKIRNTPTSQIDNPDEEDSAITVWTQKCEQFLRKYPATLVVASLAVGLTLGWLGKRK